LSFIFSATNQRPSIIKIKRKKKWENELKPSRALMVFAGHKMAMNKGLLGFNILAAINSMFSLFL
jgi:hypothetical protein